MNVTLRKVVYDITTVFKDLKETLGSNDPIIHSMSEYLNQYRYPTIQEILDTMPKVKLCEYSDSTRYDTIKNIPESGHDTITVPNYTGTPFNDMKSTSTNDVVTLPYVTDVAIEAFNYNFDSYDEFVKWGIWVINQNYPSIFKNGSSAGHHSGVFGIYGFTIQFPNDIALRIEVHDNNDSIMYYVDIMYCGSCVCFFKESNVYKSAIKNGYKEP